MLITLIYEGQRFDLTVNPQLEVDRILFEEAEEWYGDLDPGTWHEGNLDELVKSREKESRWPQVLRDVGIAFELAKEEGKSEEELRKHKPLGEDMARVYKLDGRRLENHSPLSSYKVRPRSKITLEVARKPKSVKLWTQDGTVKLLDANGKEVSLAVSSGTTFRGIRSAIAALERGEDAKEAVAKEQARAERMASRIARSPPLVAPRPPSRSAASFDGDWIGGGRELKKTGLAQALMAPEAKLAGAFRAPDGSRAPSEVPHAWGRRVPSAGGASGKGGDGPHAVGGGQGQGAGAGAAAAAANGVNGADAAGPAWKRPDGSQGSGKAPSPSIDGESGDDASCKVAFPVKLKPVPGGAGMGGPKAAAAKAKAAAAAAKEKGADPPWGGVQLKKTGVDLADEATGPAAPRSEQQGASVPAWSLPQRKAAPVSEAKENGKVPPEEKVVAVPIAKPSPQAVAAHDAKQANAGANPPAAATPSSVASADEASLQRRPPAISDASSKRAHAEAAQAGASRGEGQSDLAENQNGCGGAAEIAWEEDEEECADDGGFQLELVDGTVIDCHADDITLEDAAPLLDVDHQSATASGPAKAAEAIVEDEVVNKESIKLKRKETLNADKEKKHAVVIIEHGSLTVKAGYSGDSKPRLKQLACVGRLKADFRFMLGGGGDSERRVGDETYFETRKQFAVQYPLAGPSVDWCSVEAIWTHIFYSGMAHKPEHSPVFVAIPILSPFKYREGLLSMMFQKVCVLRAFLVNASVLPLRSVDKKTGVVVDSGHSGTYIVPIYEGHIIQHAICRLMHPNNLERDLAGSALTDELMKEMTRAGVKYIGEDFRSKTMIQNDKDKWFFVSLDPEAEEKKASNQPTSARVLLRSCDDYDISTQRFRIPELLFKGRLAHGAGKAVTGLHSILIASIRSCEVELRVELFGNIVLAGGTSRLPGLVDRLRHELLARVPATVHVGIEVLDENAHFHGASKYVTEDMAYESWYTCEDWEEYLNDLLLRQTCNLIL